MISEKENFEKMLRKETPEFVTSLINLVQIVLPSVPVDRPEGGGAGIDGFGSNWIVPPGEPAIPDPSQNRILSDISNWRTEVIWPDLSKIDWEAGAKRDIPNRDPKKMIFIILPSGPFERLHDLMGFEEALMATITDPEECKEFFSKFCDFRIEQLKYIKKYYKPDIIQFQDDWGTQKDLMFKPDFWYFALEPNIKRVVNACHELGMIFNMHTCGKVDRIIDGIVQMGPDMIDSMMVCNDLDNWMDQYGRKVIFMGGIDAQGVIDRAGVSMSEIKKEVKSRINRYAGKGYYIPLPYATGPNMGPAMLFATIYGYTYKKPLKNSVRVISFLFRLKSILASANPGATADASH